MRTTTIANGFYQARTQTPPQPRQRGLVQLAQGVLIVAGVVGLTATMLFLSLITLPLRLLGRLFRR